MPVDHCHSYTCKLLHLLQWLSRFPSTTAPSKLSEHLDTTGLDRGAMQQGIQAHHRCPEPHNSQMRIATRLFRCFIRTKSTHNDPPFLPELLDGSFQPDQLRAAAPKRPPSTFIVGGRPCKEAIAATASTAKDQKKSLKTRNPSTASSEFIGIGDFPRPKLSDSLNS